MLMIEASSPASCRVQASHIAAEADARIEFLETAFASLQAENAELRNACRLALNEMNDVLKSCAEERVHFDGDDFHEALTALTAATRPQNRSPEMKLTPCGLAQQPKGKK
jgi:hypothetical protein